MSSIVYVSFGISQWQGMVQENRYARKLETEVKAKDKTFRVRKYALPDCAELKDVQSYNGALRQWHYSQTLPYDDKGGRILPDDKVYDYMNEARTRIEQGREKCKAFFRVYVDYRAAAKVALGDAFNDKDYPPLAGLMEKFGYNIEFETISDPKQLRERLVGVPQEDVDKLVSDAETRGAQRIRGAIDSLYADLAKVLENMGEKLSVPADQKDGGIFRDTLVSNVVEMAARAAKLNFVKEPQLTTAVTEVNKMLANTTANDLRTDAEKRAATAKKAKELAAKMAAYVK
jgi:hypothetical protein